jgi:hypothetical protein
MRYGQRRVQTSRRQQRLSPCYDLGNKNKQTKGMKKTKEKREKEKNGA